MYTFLPFMIASKLPASTLSCLCFNRLLCTLPPEALPLLEIYECKEFPKASLSDIFLF